MKKFNLITFDIRGTLLTFNKSIGDIYCDAAKKFGITIDPKLTTDRFFKHYCAFSKQHPNFGLYSGLGWHKWWRIVISKTFDTIENYSEQSKNIELISDILIERFSTKNEWKLIDGSVDILEHLRNKSICTGVISNFDPRLHILLDDIDIRKYFAFVITSYEAGFLKPDERIFKEAEKRFVKLGNKFDKSTTIHIGDSFEYDYCGAKNAGWNAVFIDSSREKNNVCSSSSVVKDLHEFKERFLKTL